MIIAIELGVNSGAVRPPAVSQNPVGQADSPNRYLADLLEVEGK